MKRGAAFCLAVVAVAALNAVLRWPADTGQVHWAEWVGFYAVPTVIWAAAWVALAYAWQRTAIKRGRRAALHLPYWHILAVLIVCNALAAMGGQAHAAERSRTLRAEFMRLSPCPATGATRGACPGYQVDHREALICGGRDELSNLQWLTVEEHKAKTRVEVKLCRPRVRAATE